MNEYQAALQKLDDEEQNLLPTPRVGEMILWYPKGYIHKDNAVPATVTRQEAPGRVSITAFPAGSRPICKTGVLYAQSESALDKKARRTVLNGCWDYRVGDGPTKKSDRDYSHHLETIEARRKAVIDRMPAESQQPKPARAAGK